MITRSRLGRGAASVILAGTLLLGTTGCTFFAQQATLIPYDPSDGVSATLDSIAVRNIVGVVNDDGGAINLMMTIVNTGATGTNLNIQFESNGEKTTVTKYVNGGTTVAFGNTVEQEQIVVVSSGVPAGDLLPVYLQWGKDAGKEVLVPVIEALGDYSELAPPATTK